MGEWVNEISAKTYVVAFNRDRDSYQVALALAEVNQLACLVTDFYVGSKPFYRFPGLGHRWVAGLSPKLARGSVRAIAAQVLWKLSSERREFPHHAIAKALSNIVRRITLLRIFCKVPRLSSI